MKIIDKYNTIESLEEGDIFLLENQLYKVDSNKNLSTSFNEIAVTPQEISKRQESNSFRMRKDQKINIIEKKNLPPPPEKRKRSVDEIRNMRGNLIKVSFQPEESKYLTEGPDEWPSKTKRKKISKSEEQKRDKCAEELLNKDSFNKRYNKRKNVKAPAKSKSDVAYAICALQATGRGHQINRGRPCKDPPCHKEKKKTQKESRMVESLNRLNTLRNAIRRKSE